MGTSVTWREIDLGGSVAGGTSEKYKTGNWRVEKPVIDYGKCVKCLICWLYCPEPAITRRGIEVKIDYDYCKGCGICAEECPTKAISMVPEEV
jgi:pyruvate ferredoxin oxidoreductase delta subunit